MNESHKYNETESCVVYKQKDEGMELSMIFNKDMKTVDISLLLFVRNDEPMLEPMDAESDWIRHSAKYGHWQQIFPTLGVEDIEFLHKKTMELFGGKTEEECDNVRKYILAIDTQPLKQGIVKIKKV